jgi:hypothetical protein
VAKEIERKGKAAQQPKAPGGGTGGNPTIAQHALKTTLPEDYEEWEISEGDLPEGSNLSGNKALLEDYPEDEANSRKNKKNNPGRGKKGHPKNKAGRRPQAARRPMRGQPRPPPPPPPNLLPLLPRHAPRG